MFARPGHSSSLRTRPEAAGPRQAGRVSASTSQDFARKEGPRSFGPVTTRWQRSVDGFICTTVVGGGRRLPLQLLNRLLGYSQHPCLSEGICWARRMARLAPADSNIPLEGHNWNRAPQSGDWPRSVTRGRGPQLRHRLGRARSPAVPCGSVAALVLSEKKMCNGRLLSSLE